MFEATTSNQPSDKIADWVLRGGVALAFIFFGFDKFPSRPDGEWVKFFAQVGVGQWFRYFTGIVEIAGAVLVVFPGGTRWGLALLALTMAAASLIHIFVIHQPGNIVITGSLCLGLAFFWWAKRKA